MEKIITKIKIIVLLVLVGSSMHAQTMFFPQNVTVEETIDSTGIVAVYEFDETTSDTLFDLHNNYDGISSGSPTAQQSGHVTTYSWYFDASDDRVQLPSNLYTPGSTTYSCWFNHTAAISGFTDYLVATQSTGNPNSRILRLNGSTTRYPNFVVTNNDGDVYSVISSTAYPTGEWHHLAGVLNTSTGYSYLYVDGSVIDSVAVSGTFSSNSTATRIGAHPYASNQSLHLANGYFDQIIIYNRALSASEISTLSTGVAYEDF